MSKNRLLLYIYLYPGIKSQKTKLNRMAEGGCTDFSESEQQLDLLNMETGECANPDLEPTAVVEQAEGREDKDLQLSAFLEKAKTYVMILYRY